MTAHRLRLYSIVTIIVLGMIFVACVSRAQSVKVRGVIDGRNGATMSLQTAAGKVAVMLTPDTQAEDVEGVFHARRKQAALTALVPGLAVEVEGNYNANNQLLADTVKFKASNLQTAVDIQAGVAPEEQQEQQQQQQLQQEQKQINAEQKEQAAQAEKIAANKAAIAAVNKRFGELADYNIWDEATVYFGNGQVKVDTEYDSKLQALAAKALTVKGYMLQVQGYASKVGSAALNQRLSQERAANVVDYLEQACHVPLTNMLAPGAMGTSSQVDSDTTKEGQAENRRVVVRVLQNKGIAGN